MRNFKNFFLAGWSLQGNPELRVLSPVLAVTFTVHELEQVTLRLPLINLFPGM